MKKVLLIFLVLINCNSFSQVTGPPPPYTFNLYSKIDIDNDGFVTFEIDSYLTNFRINALNIGYDLSGYSLVLFPSSNNYMNNTNPITSPTYTNIVSTQQECILKLTYNGNGNYYDSLTLDRYFSLHYLTTVPYNGDMDQDSVLNGVEDLNNNLILLDDNTDNDEMQNFNDTDDDNDGILTINEDYNGNGSVLDDDTNSNGIIDYLDILARGTLFVNLKLFIEGYYTGESTMKSVKFNQDGVSPLSDVENITVELYQATAPFELVASTTTMLKTNGTAACSFPTTSSGSYYIAVKSKNSIQTWSANSQFLGAIPLSYDFSSVANKAFGNNLKNLGNGIFGCYSGDINQDESIDASDAPNLINDIESSEFGIKTTDLNGDGSVDGSDATYLENNSSLSIFSNHP